MFKRREPSRSHIAPSSPSAIRVGVVALESLKNMVVLPSEQFSSEFVEDIDALSTSIQEVDSTDWEFERTADQIDRSVKEFASRQETVFQQTLESVYDSMKDILKSIDGAVATSESLSNAAERSQNRLEDLGSASSVETIIAGLKSEVKQLKSAVSKHKEESKIIRHVCSQKIEQLRERTFRAEQAVKTDHLTQLHNKASFDGHLKIAILNLAAVGETHLVILDLNGFKQINDSFGHLAGDTALAEFAFRLEEFFASNQNIVARIGGDEFAIIFYGREAVLRSKLEQLQKNLATVPCKIQSVEIKLRSSVGHTQLRANQTAESAYEEADRLMYEHKRAA
jgi:diguanylate cyclase